ncbi:high affinity cAMP-specific 3',5'-cyclic phosphodiesterase 7A-like isoform X1 [Mizuhopecten yessoensis]|uniref:high affinity cAMP-specific 3',5'-cyclic phosphodiesterase 7A-like isoform X1 n=2 Tax=Mizuhopecten yessoensis TaxID=6573 RepID=UPI000B45B9C0|nr:high affinity cAMP-specific 3',5'-cyclic phosphodiesterase 7A-like isoform X1 [Mizuhopecten yessoensis]
MHLCDMSVLNVHSIPVLPLDVQVPAQFLARRGGISFASSCSHYFRPRLGRRGGISFDRKDKNAIYVRMLGDVQMKSKLECYPERRTNAVAVSDLKLLDKVSSKDYKIRWGSRFQSLHKTRRRHRPILKMTQASNSLLDQLYSKQAQCLMTKLDCWSVNMFHLDIITCGRPLFHVAFHLFQHYNLIETFSLDPMKLLRTFSLIEEGYHDNNPYHNAVHAADVTQAIHCYLQEKQLQNTIPPFEIMTCLLAAMTHDLDHPGVNQAFLIATANHLAALYENTSVLENHHWRSAIGVLHETGLLSHFSSMEWERLESQIKSLILATDITRQQEFLTRFKRYLDSGDYDSARNPSHQHFMLQIALKCADISNPCRLWDISRKWSDHVCEEFFRQGDYEQRLHIPVTPMCDRKSTTVAKIQAGFIEFVVNPLFQEWHRFLPTKLSESMLRNLKSNQAQWKEIIKEESEKNKVEIQEDLVEEAKEEAEEEEEEVNNNSDEENDFVQEARLPLTFTHLVNEDECGSSGTESRRGSCRSLSPLREIPENHWNPEIRRHSMPPVYLQKEITCVTIRRESLPHTQYIRRRSLPTAMILHTTSLDRLLGKLSPFPSPAEIGDRCVSIDSLITQPKISNLSPSFEASRLFSGLSLSSELGSVKGSTGSVKFVGAPNLLSSRTTPNWGYKGPQLGKPDNTSHTFHSQLLSTGASQGAEGVAQGETTVISPVSFNCVGAFSGNDRQVSSSVSNTDRELLGGSSLGYSKTSSAIDRVKLSPNTEPIKSKDVSKHIPGTIA